MASPRSWPLRLVLAMVVVAAHAARVAPCPGACLAPAVKARDAVAMLVARLPAGSSSRGPGH